MVEAFTKFLSGKHYICMRCFLSCQQLRGNSGWLPPKKFGIWYTGFTGIDTAAVFSSFFVRPLLGEYL